MQGHLNLLNNILPQILRNQPKLLQCRLQILNDPRRQHTQRWQVVQIFQRVLLEPEDIEAS